MPKSLGMMMKRSLVSMVSLFLLTVTTINAQDWEPMNATIQVIEECDTCFRLTPASNGQTGCLWNQETYDFTSSFSFDFKMNFGSNNAGADGICFILSGIPNQCGISGGQIGAGGIANSVIFEFDTWFNGVPFDDLNCDHVAMNLDGNLQTPSIFGPSCLPNNDVEDGVYHDATFDWDAGLNMFEIYFDGTLVLSGVFDVIGHIGMSDIYLGFSASTGGANNEQSVCPGLEIAPPLAPSFIAVIDSICAGETGSFIIESNGEDIEWSGPQGTSISQTQDGAEITFGETSGDVCIWAVGTCGNSDTLCHFVEVVLQPDVDPMDPPVICEEVFVLTDIEINGIANETVTYHISESDAENAQNPIEPPFEVNQDAAIWIRVENDFGCYSIYSVNVDIGFIDAQVIPIPPPPLCEGETLDLSSLNYFDDNGNPIVEVTWHASEAGAWDGTDQVSQIVSEEGTYWARLVSDQGCIGVIEIFIEVFPEPQVAVMDDELDCSDTLYHLITLGDPNLAWIWDGPNNFTSNDESPLIVDTGTYYVTVTDGNGCIATTSVVITGNFDLPEAVITAQDLNCENDTLQFIVEPVDINFLYEWTGPNGYESNLPEPEYSELGEYELTITTPDFCVQSFLINVDGDFEEPEVNFSLNDSLDCETTSVVVSINGESDSLEYKWDGPQNFESSEETPTLNDQGVYYVTVTGANGCTQIDSVELFADDNVPSIGLLGDTISCTNDQIDIQILTMNLGLDYVWTGPDNFMSDQEIVTISDGGLYIVSATLNGICEVIDSIFIETDTIPLDFEIQNDTLNCLNPSLTLQLVLDSLASADFNWQGPNSFESDLQNPEISDAGTYMLTVTAENGCESVESIDIIGDFDEPEFTLEGDTLTCGLLSFDLIATGAGPDVKYEWEGPDGFMSDSNVIDITVSGLYELTITAENGCTYTESIEIQSDTAAPLINLQTEDISCANPFASFEQLGDNEGLDILWQGPMSFESTEHLDSSELAGTYYISILNAENGCSSLDSFIVDIDTLAPIVDIAPAEMLGCATMSMQLEATVQFADEISWSGPGNYESNEEDPTIMVAGTYTLTATGANGCITTASVVVEQDADVPMIMVEPDFIDCDKSEAILIAEGVQEDWLVSWESELGMMFDGNQIITDEPGIYTIMINDTINNCVGTTTVEVSIDTTSPQVSFTAPQLSCSISETTIQISQGGDPIFNYVWSGPNSFESNDSEPTVVNIGSYQVTITNPQNGCSSTRNVTISSSESTFQNVQLGAQSLSCIHEFGSVQVLGFTGGNGLISYSLDGGQNFQEAPFFDSLAPGVYTLYMEDETGCSYEEDIVISEQGAGELSLVEEIEIVYKDSALVEVEIDIPLSEITSIDWFPNQYVSCDSCLATYLSPIESKYYWVTVLDNNGCEYRARVFVKVNVPGVYVPNVFSPNDDSNNDRFFVRSALDLDAEVERMAIYDRWGNMVFSAANTPLNDPEFGWNGHFSGEILNPGVFSYFIVVRIDDRIELLEGDLTLLR